MKKIYRSGAYLIYKPEFSEQRDIQYLTGFKGTTAIFLRTKKDDFLVVDSRYREIIKTQIHKGIQIITLFPGESAFKKINEVLKRDSIREVAVEGYTPIEFLEKLKNKAKGIRFVLVSGRTQSARAIKIKGEIGIIERAQKITAKMFKEILGKIRPGKDTELDVVRIIREKAFKYGAEDMSFPPIVAFGKNSASPHHTSSSAKIGTRGSLLLDFGIRYGGYCSDFTRTIWIGKSPSNEFMAAYEAVAKAQEEGIRACRFSKPKSAKEIDLAVRKFIDNSPFNGTFIHGAGHGVGLEIHEKPVLGQYSKDILRGNEVVTIEPGIYLSKKFGIRIEDVVVTGKASRILAKTSRKLIRL